MFAVGFLTHKTHKEGIRFHIRIKLFLTHKTPKKDIRFHLRIKLFLTHKTPKKDIRFHLRKGFYLRKSFKTSFKTSNAAWWYLAKHKAAPICAAKEKIENTKTENTKKIVSLPTQKSFSVTNIK